MSESHVDTVTVEVTGLGIDVYPCSFELHLAVNAIPSISIEIIPIRNKEPKASKLIYDEIADLYRELQSKAKARETKATVAILRDTSGFVMGCDSTIKLNQWVLTDVAISQITPVSAPHLIITLSHPAEVLDRTGYIYEFIDDAVKLSKKLAQVSGSSLIPLMDSVYNLVKSQLKYKKLPSIQYDGPDSEMKPDIIKFRTQGLSLGLPSKYLTDTSGKLFLQSKLGSLLDKLKASIAGHVIPTPFCASTLNRLTAQILPSVALVIAPTYDLPKLEVRTYAPWKKPSLTLESKRIVSISMPSSDMYPLLGTGMCVASHDIEVVTGDNSRSSKDERAMNSLFYVPPKAKQLIGKATGGFIQDIGDSSIITGMRSIDLGEKKKPKDLQDTENEVESAKLLEARKTYLKETFNELYMRQSTASVTATLSSDDYYHETLYPGSVISIYDEEANKELMYGYLTEMLISGSTGGNCSTTIQMTHARHPQAELLVDYPQDNLCYQ